MMQNLVMKVISSDDKRFTKGLVFVHLADGRALPLSAFDEDTRKRIIAMTSGAEPDAPTMQLSVWEIHNVKVTE